MIKHMIEDSYGDLFIASGAAWRHYVSHQVRDGELPAGQAIPGTVVSIRFDRGNVADFSAMLAKAQSAVGLTS